MENEAEIDSCSKCSRKAYMSLASLHLCVSASLVSHLVVSELVKGWPFRVRQEAGSGPSNGVPSPPTATG
jgi:hypothetical protein